MGMYKERQNTNNKKRSQKKRIDGPRNEDEGSLLPSFFLLHLSRSECEGEEEVQRWVFFCVFVRNPTL